MGNYSVQFDCEYCDGRHNLGIGMMMNDLDVKEISFHDYYKDKPQNIYGNSTVCPKTGKKVTPTDTRKMYFTLIK